MKKDDLLLNHLGIDIPRELDMALLGRRGSLSNVGAGDRYGALVAVMREGAQAPETLLRMALAEARGTHAAAGDALQRMDKGYLGFRQAAGSEWTRQQQRAAFLQHFRSRLTFAGSDVVPECWSHIGWIDDDPDRPLCLSRDGGHVMLVSGSQNAGKTVFSSVLAEGCLLGGEPTASPWIRPGCFVFFHLEEHDRLPQLLDSLKPNPVRADLELLMERLGVGPATIPALRLAIPRSLMTPELLRRLRPYQDLGLEIVPISVHLGQLGQPGLEAALGAEEGSRFVQRVLEDAQDQGQQVTVSGLRRFIDSAEDLNAQQKRAAHARLRVLEEIEAGPEDPGLWQMVGPNLATVFYLGGPHMGHGRVAPMLVSLMNGLLRPSAEHGPMQRTIVVDEMNLLHKDDPVWQAFIRTGRLVRHTGSTLVLMGQDLLCVPPELFGLAGLVGVMGQRGPLLWEHVRERVGALRGHRWEEVARLLPGEMLLAATLTTDPRWQQAARRVRVRPLRWMHGGFTRAAV